MMSYLASKGITLQQRLDQIYEEYGYYTESVLSFTYEGSSGKQKMSDIMKQFRSFKVGDTFAGYTISEVIDLLDEIVLGLPSSDVIMLRFASGDKLVVRPSGTEPKIKYYLFFHTAAENRKAFQASLQDRISRFKSEL